MPIKIIQSFRKGEEVPSWLLEIKSADPEASKEISIGGFGSISFGFDCHILEVSMGFVVIPDNETRMNYAFKVNYSDKSKLVIFASSRTVHTPVNFMISKGQSDSGFGSDS